MTHYLTDTKQWPEVIFSAIAGGVQTLQSRFRERAHYPKSPSPSFSCSCISAGYNWYTQLIRLFPFVDVGLARETRHNQLTQSSIQIPSLPHKAQFGASQDLSFDMTTFNGCSVLWTQPQGVVSGQATKRGRSANSNTPWQLPYRQYNGWGQSSGEIRATALSLIF